MASIDLIDVVDVGLLLKRLRIIRLPEDIVKLKEIWLLEQFFYVEGGNQT